MKISVFPKAKAHPVNKEEKRRHSFFASNPYSPDTVSVKDQEELIEVIINNTWSPIVFSEFRRESDFISADVIGFDIDEGMEIDEAEAVVQNLDITCLCLPSTSHTDEHHKFRLIFPLSRTIRDIATYKATYAKLAENFPVDPQCHDAARFYFGSKMLDGFWYEGELVEPVAEKPVNSSRIILDNTVKVVVAEDMEELVEELYGEKREKVPEQVMEWLEGLPTGMPGKWHSTCNTAIFTMGLQNVPFENVEAVFRHLAPDDLDDHDEYVLDRAWNDGYNAREDSL